MTGFFIRTIFVVNQIFQKSSEETEAMRGLKNVSRSHSLAEPRFIPGSLAPEFVSYKRLPLYVFDPIHCIFKEAP